MHFYFLHLDSASTCTVYNHLLLFFTRCGHIINYINIHLPFSQPILSTSRWDHAGTMLPFLEAKGLSSDDAEHLKEKFGENLLEAQMECNVNVNQRYYDISAAILFRYPLVTFGY